MKQIAALEVDIGVSKLHVGAVSLVDGTSIAESEAPYQWDVLADGRGEINPDKIWNVAQDALEKVLPLLDMSRIEIKALSFSCFGDCFVGVDAAGDPVYPMLLFSDLRAMGLEDAQCGYLGLGVKPDNADNVIANNAGTYNLFGTLSRNRLILDTPTITPGCGPIRGSYHFQAGEMIGPTMDWFTQKIAHSNLSTLFAKARFDATCRVRMTRDPINGDGAFEGISVLHDESDLFTGMIESFTLPMKGWYEAMKSTARDGRFSTMRIGAGGAKSESWIQLKANILGIPVEKVENLQSSSVGLAMICAVAMGECADYGEACDRLVHVARVYEPDMKLYERYREQMRG